jgi:Family of unknown function (DUF6600)
MNQQPTAVATRLYILLVLAALILTFSGRAAAQDQGEDQGRGQDQGPGQDQNDPPGRAARLGYLQGAVSFQPAGESDWVEAVPNRPMTIGDKLWADKDSRAEVQLGSASIRLAPNTGISFLNLDDRTVQVQLSAGTVDVRVRRLSHDDVFEIDTSNQAFSIFQPGRYRLDASEDGSSTVITVREGDGESTGNGQTYTVRAGQRATFSGTQQLNAEVEDIRGPDDFDNWSNGRERRYEESPSARYCAPDMVGSQDLDEYGDWHPSPEYGNVWYPRVERGWAPYHEGHWAWIDPWGWTWVDDDPWGYAPFHYGRWAFVEDRWGWIPGPVAVAPVYAPALVVFVGGGGGFGGNVGWFPLGPREVYVPPYGGSREYVNRVNVSNTTVNQTTVTNVYNTTIVNNNTTINNVTYVNKNVAGAVTAVPQHAFASAQPVARSAVAVNPRELSAASVNARATVAPSREAVLGAHANTANHVAAPPQAVASRPVIAKATPPPPPAPFAARQQALAAHPGRPIARQQLQQMARQNPPRSQPQVRQAPPGKPATAVMARPGNQPANQPANRPGNPPPPGRPAALAQPHQPQPSQPAPGNRPQYRPQPNQPPQNRPMPNQPTPSRPEMNQPNRPAQPAPNERPALQPNNRPESAPVPNRPEQNQPEPSYRPEPNRPSPANQPASRPAEPPRSEPQRPQNPPPPQREQQRNPPPAETRPAPAPQRQPTPQEKKKQEDEQRRGNEKPQGPG